MFVKRQDVAIVTSAGGVFSGVTADVCQGSVLGVLYTPDPTNPLASTASFVVTATDTKQPVLTFAPGNQLAFQSYPQSPVHSVAAGAVIAGRSEYVPLGGQESVTVAVSAGGNALKGTITILTGGP